jgi:hypothetical protein
MGLQFHPELDGELLELWITDDLRGGDNGDLARLGLQHDDLRAHTARHVDDAARRLRKLVQGFQDRITG